MNWRRLLEEAGILRKIALKSLDVLATPEIRKTENIFRVQGNGAEGEDWNTQACLLVAVVTGCPSLVS